MSNENATQFFTVHNTCRLPSGRRADRASAMTIDLKKGAKAGVHSVTEKILANASEYTELVAIRDQTKAGIESLTLPGMLKGERLCPAQNLAKIIALLDEKQAEYNAAAAIFYRNLSVIDAKVRLATGGEGISVNPGDYNIAMENMVVPFCPEKGIANLPVMFRERAEQEIANLRASLLAKAKDDLIARLTKPLESLVDALDNGVRLHDSLRQNLIAMAREVSDLAGDARLRVIADEIEAWGEMSPAMSDISKDQGTRAAQSKVARELKAKALEYAEAEAML